jgi:hypothetical protein
MTLCEKFARGLQILYPFTPVTNLPEGCQQPMVYFQEGCPNCTQRGNLRAIPLKKVKFKLKTKKQELKTIRGSSPNKALSIHTTTSPSESRETVPVK